jgi:hypothetical protein
VLLDRLRVGRRGLGRFELGFGGAHVSILRR